ncbi:MAG: hypothetical protein G01um10147_233 [Microgenomates group bacterium Gr01-1014_7]|nr:MAG: hypothetical protein G01um10147_233 [Microgenomates group bacterium Gr01-1014_7]
MLITNHVLAGSIIGFTVKEPSLAIILAFASHFVMDALPHFGYPGRKGWPEALKHKLSYIAGFIALFSTLIVSLFLITNNMWFPFLCGFVAASPDLAGWYNYAFYEKHGKSATGILELLHVQFHRRIQKFERPWGLYIEAIVFAVLLMIFFAYNNS